MELGEELYRVQEGGRSPIYTTSHAPKSASTTTTILIQPKPPPEIKIRGQQAAQPLCTHLVVRHAGSSPDTRLQCPAKTAIGQSMTSLHALSSGVCFRVSP
ncbi:hypothetical protein BJX63DRAFT_375814 [Aspergillus granulosus]|uniref:Uncharacterized protein n=1 Tax=Aspergillus granulosus TaxID=176169 RepID=A0ABR4I5E4_9EURO